MRRSRLDERDHDYTQYVGPVRGVRRGTGGLHFFDVHHREKAMKLTPAQRRFLQRGAQDTEGRIEIMGPRGLAYTARIAMAERLVKIGLLKNYPHGRAEYEITDAGRAEVTYLNGRPKWAADGTLLNEKGDRSIFDDVDK
jgi:hypothetical protein